MDENTFKIGANSDTAAQTTANQPLATTTIPTPQITQPPTNQPPTATSAQLPSSQTSPLQAPPTTPSSPNINTKLNVQLDKSVDTQLGRLSASESKLLSTKSYLIIGILVIALAAASYGAYIFFFTAESSTEENFEDITLTNKLGESEDFAETTEETSSPPSLTINLSEEEDTASTTDVTTTDTDTGANTSTNSTKVPR